MYVAVSGYGKARVIQFREEKRIPGTGKKKTRVIKTLGNYERMLAEDPDILIKLKAEAASLMLVPTDCISVLTELPVRR